MPVPPAFLRSDTDNLLASDEGTTMTETSDRPVGGVAALAESEPMPETAMAIPHEASPPLGGGRQWWLITVLTLLFVLSFIDRNVIRTMVDPIRLDLHLTDVQISVLDGMAFAVLYSLACLPLGHAADRVNRRTLLGFGVFCWSGMSMLCGAAGSYGTLFVGRMGLGIGEATLQPCAMSMIRDSFPPDRRARPLSIYTTGPLIGSALALVIGGALYGFAQSGGARGIPILGALRPWQFALVVPGLIGIGLAALVFTVREPRRIADDPVFRPGLGDTLRHMRANAKLYMLTFAMPTLWSLGNTGWNAWLIAAIDRQRHISPAVTGPTAGVIALVCSTIGSIGLGFYIDHLSVRGDRDAILRVSAIIQCVQIVPALAMFFMPTMTLLWVSYGFATLLIGSTQIAAFAIMAEITPGVYMGKTIALFNLVQNFLGQALGSTVFALVAAWFFAGETGIIWSIVVCYPVVLIISSILAVMLMRLRRSGSEMRPISA